MHERFGWDWPIVSASDSPNASADQIILADQKDNTHAEGYVIECSDNSLRIESGQPVGFFYAAQTLSQLISTDSNGAFIPACSMVDWPSLAFRGVHIYPGHDVLDLHRTLIERIFADTSSITSSSNATPRNGILRRKSGRIFRSPKIGLALM